MIKGWEKAMRSSLRSIEKAKAGDDELGPFKWLPEGVWRNDGQYGWNLVALPYTDERADPAKNSRGYRLLVNKCLEELEFQNVDKGVPNRGVEPSDGGNDFEGDCVKPIDGKFIETDQFVLALDYEQEISQVEAVDFPVSGKAGGKGLKIHHEPGFFLRMTEPVATTIQRKPTIQNIPLNLARLATIPHGDSVLALGSCQELEYTKEKIKGIVDDKAFMKFLGIPDPDMFPIGLPIGTTKDEKSDYLEPYRKAIIDDFEPARPQIQLLNDLKDAIGLDRYGDPGDFPIKRTTRIWFDSELETGGILNIPFVTRQANAEAMRSTFWIHELHSRGKPKLVLQYSQTVLMDFHLVRSDDNPGRIRWPHISINTLKLLPR